MGGEVKFPDNSVLNNLKVDDDGTITIPNSTRNNEADRARKKVEKEQKEILEAVLKDVADDIIERYYLYVYKDIDASTYGSGVTKTFKFKVPLNILKDVDIEAYIKERVCKGSYSCQVRDIAGRWPKGSEIEKISLCYLFEEDGEIWLKNMKNKQPDIMHDEPRKDDKSIVEIAGVISDAYKTANENRIESGNNGQKDDSMAALVGSLVTSVVNKPKDNSMVELVTALVPVLTTVLQPKNNDPALESIRMMADSVKEISASIMNTNNKLVEIDKKNLEERHKDKLEMMELVNSKHSNNNNGNNDVVSGMSNQMLKMMEVSNQMNTLVLGNMLNMFKTMMDAKGVLGRGNEDKEDTESPTLGQVVIDRMLNPATWKAGLEAFQAIKSSGGSDESAPTEKDMEEEVSVDNLKDKEKDDIVYKKYSEAEIMHNKNKDTKKNGINKEEYSHLKILLNDIVRLILANIKSDVAIISDIVIKAHSNEKLAMRKILALNTSDGSKMLDPKLLMKVTLNLQKFQNVMEHLKNIL